MTIFRHTYRSAAVLGLLLGGGCSSGEAAPAASSSSADARVIEVVMRDDGGDTRFEPSRIDVRRGDVVRFVQEGSMPHNVQFVRNELPGDVDLGDAWSGPFLSRVGETYEIHVDDRFPDGEYEYVCAPHIALGMKGTLSVSGATESREGAAGPAEGAAGPAQGSTNPAEGPAGAAAGSAAPPAGRATAGSPSENGPDVPVITGEQGLRPLDYELDGDTKVFRLTAERIRWETAEGKIIDAMAYNRMIPGPLIRVQEGDRVRIVVTNLLDEPHTTHWHGLFVPNAMDGVPGITQEPIAPGDSFEYEFVAEPSGTRLYHSHFNALRQEGAGLHGMFVIEERTPPAARQADREEIMLLGDGALGFVINGKEFPMTEPIHMQLGERVRVRMANLGGMYHPMHMHGGFMTVVAKDGFPLPEPQQVNTVSIAPGETWDVILHPQYAGVWIWHCHVLSHVTGARDADGNDTSAGMIGAIVVDDGEAPLPDLGEHTNH